LAWWDEQGFQGVWCSDPSDLTYDCWEAFYDGEDVFAADIARLDQARLYSVGQRRGGDIDRCYCMDVGTLDAEGNCLLEKVPGPVGFVDCNWRGLVAGENCNDVCGGC